MKRRVQRKDGVRDWIGYLSKYSTLHGWAWYTRTNDGALKFIICFFGFIALFISFFITRAGWFTLDSNPSHPLKRSAQALGSLSRAPCQSCCLSAASPQRYPPILRLQSPSARRPVDVGTAPCYRLSPVLGSGYV